MEYSFLFLYKKRLANLFLPNPCATTPIDHWSVLGYYQAELGTGYMKGEQIKSISQRPDSNSVYTNWSPKSSASDRIAIKPYVYICTYVYIHVLKLFLIYIYMKYKFMYIMDIYPCQQLSFKVFLNGLKCNVGIYLCILYNMQ